MGIDNPPTITGTVSTMSIVSANGFAGTVANPTTTPAVTISTTITGITKGNGTALSAATAGTDYSAGTSGLATGLVISTTGTGALTVVAAPSGTVVGDTDTQTLTNKRVNPRTATIASSATPTPNADTTDFFYITAQAAGATFGAPTGTPVEGQRLTIRIKDNASPRTLAYNAIYRAGTDVALPTTTVASKTMYLGFIYNFEDTTWDFVSSIGNI